MLTLMENYINGQEPNQARDLQVLRDAEADPGAIGWVAQVFPGLCAEAEQKGPPGDVAPRPRAQALVRVRAGG